MDLKSSFDKLVHLSTAGLSDEEAFDYRHSMSGETYRLRIGRRGEGRSAFETTMRTVSGCVLSNFWSTPIIRSRDRRSVLRDARPYLKIRQYVSGAGCTVVSGERSWKLRPGDIHLMNQSCEFTEICSGGQQRNILLSHDSIGFDPEKHGPITSLTLEGPAGKLVEAAFDDVFPGLSRSSHAEVARATEDLVTLLRTVLEGGAASGLESTVVSARTRRIRRLVAENLSDPEFRPSSVVHMMGVSRATIYRDFTNEGGLERYIFKSRLERAFDLLSKTAPNAGAVERVALSVGFNSVHHFSNAFNKYFKMRPSDVSGLLWGHDAVGHMTDLLPLSSNVQNGKHVFEVARGIAS